MDVGNSVQKKPQLNCAKRVLKDGYKKALVHVGSGVGTHPNLVLKKCLVQSLREDTCLGTKLEN